MDKHPVVYILTNHPRNTVLHIGVTSDICGRMFEHKNNSLPGSFSSRYNTHKLVYFEQFNDIDSAITREKRLKYWKRRWKEKLITEFNPLWEDLTDFLCSESYNLMHVQRDPG